MATSSAGEEPRRGWHPNANWHLAWAYRDVGCVTHTPPARRMSRPARRMTGAFPEAAMLVQRLPVFYKQRRFGQLRGCCAVCSMCVSIAQKNHSHERKGRSPPPAAPPCLLQATPTSTRPGASHCPRSCCACPGPSWRHVSLWAWLAWWRCAPVNHGSRAGLPAYCPYCRRLCSAAACRCADLLLPVPWLQGSGR